MRIRRIAATSAVKPNIKRRGGPFAKFPPPPASDDAIPRDSSMKAQNAFSRPTSNSPLHPNSFRYDLGLYKYTTGMLKVSVPWSRPAEPSLIALKVYSREPTEKGQIMRALRSALRSSSAFGDLRAQLNQILELLLKVHGASETIEDVFFQIFGHTPDSKKYKIVSNTRNATGKIPGGWFRSWNLRCQLHRKDDSSDSLSKPWVDLQMPDMYFYDVCKFQDTYFLPSQLQLRLAFHLKPHLLDSNLDGAVQIAAAAPKPLEGPIQMLVDRVLEDETRAISGQVFADADEMVSKVRDAVLANLGTSTLTPLVDFHHIEVTAIDPKHERLVTNTLLNADGTIKLSLKTSLNGSQTYRATSSKEPTPPLPSSPRLPATSLFTKDHYGLGRNLRDGKIPYFISDQLRPLSQDVQIKSGVHGLKTIRLYPMNASQHVTGLATPAELLEHFNAFCRAVQGTGLVCFASATALLAARFPHVDCNFESDSIPINIGSSTDETPLGSSPSLSGSFRDGSYEITVKMPILSTLESLVGKHGTVSVRCRVSLYFHLHPEVFEERRDSSIIQMTTSNELSILTQMTSTIVTGILKGVNFDSYEAVPDLLAEGIVRTIQFPSPSIILHRVRVVIRLPEDSPLGACDIAAEKFKNHNISQASDPVIWNAYTPSVSQMTDAAVHTSSLDNQPNASREVDLPDQPEKSDSTADSIPGDEAHDGISASDVLTARGFEEGKIPRKRVYVALGSNVGDRLQNIENGCRELDAKPDIRVLRKSALYETTPMYVENQDRFLNGVCEIETTLRPLDLLDKLQAIELKLGRVKTIDKGPRNIDLDILLYENEKHKTERLEIPHPLMLEREFVLRPLCDIRAARSRKVRGHSYYIWLSKLPKAAQPMYAVTSLGPTYHDIHVGSPQHKAHIMSIMNVTPDSFSDGGVYNPTDTEKLTSFVKSQIAAGATIIDIGGQSSRPNAPDVTASEELARILPAIELVKSMPEAADVAISVDTYRATVAEAAINAGAHIINDISAGMLDQDMLATVAKLGCTYIMMHMRGTPATMMSDDNCTYDDGLIPTIAKELEARIDAAQDAGIRRWRIILDPGIGFSKHADQNLEILRRFPELRQPSKLRNFAWLVGSSRKSFIGKITGVKEPKERGWGTAATVTAAIQGGADIVRVHDAEEMGAVVKMADAIYRV